MDITFSEGKPAVLKDGEPAKDYIGFTENPKLLNLIDSNERVLFADKIKKFMAHCTFKQNRILVITTCKIYNIKKDKV